MIYENAWASVVVFAQQLVAEVKALNPGVLIEFCDWDAHANMMELPNADLIGPLSLAVTEHSTDMISVSFAIGVSTYVSDKNLFRQRDYIARAFEKMKAQQKITYYDAQSASQESVLVMTNGTTATPMSKAEVRPWQYVQGEALLVPAGEA
jgi:hypothetical protein